MLFSYSALLDASGNMLNVGTTGDPITQVEQEMVLAVKLPTSAPAIGDAMFKLYPMIFISDDGRTGLIFLRNSSSLTFNAGATTATANFTIRGFERATDIASVQAVVQEGDPVKLYTVNPISANGQIDMSNTTGSDESLIEGIHFS